MSKSNTSDEVQSVKGQAHKYFHMMLNMADDDLDPYQYRLLGHYIRKIGHGENDREGLKQTARICRMSLPKLRKTRDELVTMGYINITEPTEAEQAQGIAAVIEVMDRWAENIARYAKKGGEVVPGKNIDPVEAEPGKNIDPPPVSNIYPLEEQEEKQEQKNARAPIDDIQTTGLSTKVYNFDELYKPINPAMNDTIAFMEAQKYMRAYEDAFPANAPIRLPNSNTNRETALFLLKAGYNPDDVTELVKQKIAGGKSYPFAWLQSDMSGFVTAREKPAPNILGGLKLMTTDDEEKRTA